MFDRSTMTHGYNIENLPVSYRIPRPDVGFVLVHHECFRHHVRHWYETKYLASGMAAAGRRLARCQMWEYFHSWLNNILLQRVCSSIRSSGTVINKFIADVYAKSWQESARKLSIRFFLGLFSDVLQQLPYTGTVIPDAITIWRPFAANQAAKYLRRADRLEGNPSLQHLLTGCAI